jgi:hypothetical protein
MRIWTLPSRLSRTARIELSRLSLVAEQVLRILLAQNVPQTVSGWLQDKLPDRGIESIEIMEVEG